MEERKRFVGKSLRVFVSYSNKDKLLAHGLKKGLESYGLDVFLAHDDIPGGSEWEETIYKTIKQTDVFLQLLTKNYRESEWTDQETGIALSDKKMIIPLKVDIFPYDFVKKYQAFNLKYEEKKYASGVVFWCKESCLEIIKFIFKNEDLKQNLKDCLIRSFVGSPSFQDSRDIANLLKKYNDFSKEQLDEIIKGSVDNRQIHESSGSSITFLKEIVEKYNVIIDKKEIDKLKSLLPSL